MAHEINFLFHWKCSLVLRTARTRRLLCHRPRGPMDKVSDYGSEDSRFESWRGRFLSVIVFNREVIGSLQELEFLDLQRAMVFGGLMA